MTAARAPALRDPLAARRLGTLLAAAAVAWPVLAIAQFKPWLLLDLGTLRVLGSFLAGFLPPDTSADFAAQLWQGTLQTLAMATAGTALAALLAIPLALATTAALSVSRLGPGRQRWRGAVVRGAARLMLLVLRSIPEVVWALLLVRTLGLGPAAGVLAIAITYSGMLGKVYSEIMDSTDLRASRALLEAGGGRLGALCYGLLPGASQELVSYTVYRWECAVRASVVMGFVGAGGLGQLMEQSMKMLDGGQACSILLLFMALVMLADALSVVLRRCLA